MLLEQKTLKPIGPWPLRWLYPFTGALLGCAIMSGFIALRAAHTDARVTPDWLISEFRTDLPIYVYLVATIELVLVILGLFLGRKEDRLQEAATTDEATGLANRRYLESRLAHELSCASQLGTPVTLLLIDVDRLKRINDQFGHGMGDAALRLVAEALRRTCRSRDLAARWGGDEFAVLASGTGAGEAWVLAERIRNTLQSLAQADPTAPPMLSVSIGIADTERAGSKPDLLFNAADKALYLAKAGRDRTVIVPPVSILKDHDGWRAKAAKSATPN